MLEHMEDSMIVNKNRIGGLSSIYKLVPVCSKCSYRMREVLLCGVAIMACPKCTAPRKDKKRSYGPGSYAYGG